MRRLLLWMAQNKFLRRRLPRLWVTRRAVRKFMPGERPEDALAAGKAIAATDRGLIYTKLGEAITSADEAVAVRDHYLGFFDQIRAMQLPAHVSVKPTQLGYSKPWRSLGSSVRRARSATRSAICLRPPPSGLVR